MNYIEVKKETAFKIKIINEAESYKNIPCSPNKLKKHFICIISIFNKWIIPIISFLFSAYLQIYFNFIKIRIIISILKIKIL